MTRYSRCCPPAGGLLCFVSRLPWDSTRRGWTAGSTIHTLAGREKDCGQPTAPALLFTRKVVKERRARSCISSFAPTHSRTRRLTRAPKAFRITGKTPGNWLESRNEGAIRQAVMFCAGLFPSGVTEENG